MLNIQNVNQNKVRLNQEALYLLSVFGIECLVCANGTDQDFYRAEHYS